MRSACRGSMVPAVLVLLSLLALLALFIGEQGQFFRLRAYRLHQAWIISVSEKKLLANVVHGLSASQDEQEAKVYLVSQGFNEISDEQWRRYQSVKSEAFVLSVRLLTAWPQTFTCQSAERAIWQLTVSVKGGAHLRRLVWAMRWPDADRGECISMAVHRWLTVHAVSAEKSKFSECASKENRFVMTNVLGRKALTSLVYAKFDRNAFAEGGFFVGGSSVLYYLSFSKGNVQALSTLPLVWQPSTTPILLASMPNRQVQVITIGQHHVQASVWPRGMKRWAWSWSKQGIAVAQGAVDGPWLWLLVKGAKAQWQLWQIDRRTGLRRGEVITLPNVTKPACMQLEVDALHAKAFMSIGELRVPILFDRSQYGVIAWGSA